VCAASIDTHKHKHTHTYTYIHTQELLSHNCFLGFDTKEDAFKVLTNEIGGNSVRDRHYNAVLSVPNESELYQNA
jgi:uncharacterized protein YhbP (UPF0306 family)